MLRSFCVFDGQAGVDFIKIFAQIFLHAKFDVRQMAHRFSDFWPINSTINFVGEIKCQIFRRTPYTGVFLFRKKVWWIRPLENVSLWRNNAHITKFRHWKKTDSCIAFFHVNASEWLLVSILNENYCDLWQEFKLILLRDKVYKNPLNQKIIWLILD